MDPKIYPELELECERLRRENAHLRQLLKLDINNQGITSDKLLFVNTEIDQTLPNKLDFNSTIAFSTKDKITLFRSLFRGRETVYAVRWEGKQGRSGYSPACANEWDRRVCRKPAIKCSVCPHSQWLPITDQVIHDHLTGKKMVGIYPLTTNETCYFLAVDFDKTSWRQDAKAFVNTCRCFNIAAILERSQSGNGAHVWIFFSEPIPANIARNLGTGLLTQTMQEYDGIDLGSYDRLFPNQDTLPRGGFGNLIALPLQGARRKLGNSVFLDDALEPYLDQWAFLASICPMKHQEVLSVIEQLSHHGSLLDVPTIQHEEENEEPWGSTKHNIKYVDIREPLPKSIKIVLANLLYVPRQHLPNILVNQIKRIAAFQNPDFYKAKRMRLSTYGKPRIISCAEEFPDHIGLPRGCENELFELLKHYNIATQLCDKTEISKVTEFNFLGELRSEQQIALDVMHPHRYGVLAATTAFGKTIVAAGLIANRRTNTLILVHRRQLLKQWQERLSSLFGISSKEIGILGDGRNKLTGIMDIAMLQSLTKKGIVRDEVTQYGHVVVDECHHLSAFSFEQILKKSKSPLYSGVNRNADP